MGEESFRDDYEDLVGGDDDGGRVMDWATGLPSLDDLTPLSQPLVPPDLASAFSISPEPARTILDVHRASQSTFSSLRLPPNCNTSHPENQEAEAEADDPSAKALKRPRLVWTPQLHKRFVDVVAHLGIKNAVPKTIMQLMNVEGLTRENVASHLQKYRLYLKRMQGLSNEGPSPSDQLFSSTPVPPSLQEAAATTMAPAAAPPPPQPMQYSVPTMFPMPVYSRGNNGHIGMVPMNNSYKNYGGFVDQGGRDWPTGGSKFGSFVSYPPHRVSPNDN